MDRRSHVKRRRKAWRRFESLVKRAEGRKGPALTPRELAEFSRLFREMAYDLATVRSRGWGQRLENYLNDIVARGHNAFYKRNSFNIEPFVRFFTVEFPQLFRKNINYFIVASALFYLPFFVTWAVVQLNPSLGTRVVAVEQLEQAADMYSYDPDDTSRSGITEARAMMGGFYVRHNVGIALRCFAGGAFCGIVTIYTLLSNGIAIGAIAGYICSQGNAKAFTSFIISHGSFELTAIGVAGGAGLMLGNALIHPGDMTRRQSLQTRGRDAVMIASGAAAMLIIAAVIEAFWSPASIHSMFKYVVGSMLWVCVILYLSIAGRGDVE